MGKHMPDIHHFPVIVNGGNQAVFVSSDIEHGKFFHLVCRGECDPQFRKGGVISFPDYGVPVVQRNTGIGMLLSKLDQPFSRDDMDRTSLSQYEIGVKMRVLQANSIAATGYSMVTLMSLISSRDWVQRSI